MNEPTEGHLVRAPVEDLHSGSSHIFLLSLDKKKKKNKRNLSTG